MKIAVLGAGAWGTALAIRFTDQHAVTLWARDAEQVAEMDRLRENTRYLPGITFPPALALHADFERSVGESELVVVVTPTSGLAETLARVHACKPDVPVLWACKGFEAETLRPAHEVAARTLKPSTPRGILTGPSFAAEVARGLPAALTLASDQTDFAQQTAAALHSPRLRVYSSADVIGAEVGGAVKNVMAIAAGVCDGLQLGQNARAALLTRGLAEITRLGVALGAQPETFMGLSGLGDLILTATGDLSRNRKVGLMLAQGLKLDEILTSLGHVAEGVNTARAVLAQAERHQVDMPITRAVCRMLFEQIPPRTILAELMGRTPKSEQQ